MATSTLKGKIDDKFTATLQSLATQATTHGQAAQGAGLRSWNRPDAVTDLLDIKGITAGFDRTAINTNYQALINDPGNPGTTGDAVSAKTQCDVVAVLERVFRARHCTPVRLIGMMAARRAGHGNAQGVCLGGIARYVQDVLRAGQN